MHNESRSDRENEPNESKPVKPSKKSRIKSVVVAAGWIIIPTALTAAPTIVFYKTGKMHFDAAKLNLEAAKLAAGIANTQS